MKIIQLINQIQGYFPLFMNKTKNILNKQQIKKIRMAINNRTEILVDQIQTINLKSNN